MKFAPNKILMLLAYIMSCNITVAAPSPPPPLPPPPPGFPVDNGIYILFAISLLYGFYKLYQINTKKASN
jgi:hypothetical protein